MTVSYPLTVVVPAIDEAATLPALLADLNAQCGVTLQIIVADGGSGDDTLEQARVHGADVVSSPAGRGRQMNAGADAAHHGWLCFLHADTRLTHRWQLHAGIARLAAENDTRVAGHFPLCFIRRTRGHDYFYRYITAKTATGRQYTINGDQGLLLRRSFFDALGGFDTRMNFLEDQRMAAAIEGQGRWCLLAHRLATSARRFEREGEGARYKIMTLIMAMYVADVPMFFERAPQLYARQSDTGRVLIMPYIRLLRRMVHACGLRASLIVAWRIAGVTLAQSWQMFFAADIGLEPLIGTGRRPFTRLYDRYLHYAIVHPPAQALVLVVVAAWVFGPLQLRSWLDERRWLKKRRVRE